MFKDCKSNKFHYKRESFLTDFSSKKTKTVIVLKKGLRRLLELQKGKFKTREALATYLGINLRTQERWVIRYISGGITGLLTGKPKNITSRIITPPDSSRIIKTCKFK